MSDSLQRSTDNEKVLLGHLTGVYGLKGWVKVHSDTSPRENIISFSRWWIENSGSGSGNGPAGNGPAGNGQWVEVLEGRPQGKTLIARLRGVNTPEEGSLLTGASIAVERSDMPDLQDGEYYWSDLIGMQVQTLDGTQIGPVSRLFETGANDVMVVKDSRNAGDAGDTGKNAREVLVPWLVPDVITDVNQQNGMITVDWDPDF